MHLVVRIRVHQVGILLHYCRIQYYVYYILRRQGFLVKDTYLPILADHSTFCLDTKIYQSTTDARLDISVHDYYYIEKTWAV